MLAALLWALGAADEQRCGIVLKNEMDDLVWKVVSVGFNEGLVWAFFPLASLSFLFILVTQIRVRETRSQPGDVIFLVSIFSYVLAVSYLSTSIYYASNKQSNKVPPSFAAFCDATGFFNLVCGSAIYIYNGLLFVNMMLQTRHSLHRGRFLSPRYMHGTAILLLCVIVAGSYGSKSIGLTVYGVCSVQSTYVSAFIEVAVMVSFFVMAVLSMARVRRMIPDDPGFRKVFFRNYAAYMCFYSLLVLVQCFSKLSTTIMCLSSSLSNIDPFITVGNTTNLAILILLAAVRLFHPSVWASVNVRFSGGGGSPLQPLFQHQDWVTDFNNEVQEQQLLTVAGSLQLALLAEYHIPPIDVYYGQLPYLQKLQFHFEDRDFQGFKLQGKTPIKSSFISWAYQSFKHLRLLAGEKDLHLRLPTDFTDLLLDIGGNETPLRGKDGRYCYRLVRLRNKQFLNFGGIIRALHQHLEEYPSSLLEWPLGLFNFQREDGLDRRTSYTLFREAFVPDECLLKSYKLRVLLNPKQELQDKLMSPELKFGLSRFLKEEERLWLDSCQSQKIRETLFRDLLFLQSVDAYCYHLRVKIINLDSLLRVKGISQAEALSEGLLASFEHEVAYRRKEGQPRKLYQLRLEGFYKVSKKLKKYERLKRRAVAWLEWLGLADKSSLSYEYMTAFLGDVVDQILHF